MPYKNKLDAYRLESGQLPTCAFPGGYPIYYVFADNAICCPDCANGKNGSLANTTDSDDEQWYLVDCDINYEDIDLYCEHCNTKIEAAYDDADDDENPNKE